ncbi:MULTISPECIES: ABC transporter ATP-binding protein [Peptoniphilus]|uniref:Quaternary amine transport ATP-binding protein n=1 Tax=Peptoniphilus lacrimalis TaxID=33031 RepID=A0A379C817_9FIRM|nr:MULTISPECIES: betaine/proline/choline family ABC transporter ATP-binding protein [Peptoniphilus]EFK38741.1 glycine betaine/L-proline transport ATP binding subunit [Peptoniphilus sp. oral taxon 836 str. F0141]SUB57845.1 Glycine betaine/L-proline transport ATP-binding protein ProV [Peptoniphilus lacrimalis]
MIEFRNVKKIYPGNQVAVTDINLKFNTGEFICFIGLSGSGKTTCMRMINRMNELTEGEILIDGINIKDINPVSLRRKIGYVIQQIGLFPHMSVYDNIVLVPRLLKWDERKNREIAEDLIKKVDLPLSYLDKFPGELSGGQQQRIGVIRALAANQDIILMDEPFGALDPITRDSLQKLVKKLQKEMGKTIVFVSHDMDEALTLADKIVIMNKGTVVQFDTPENILKNPKNDYVRDLLGEEKLNEAKTSLNSVETIMIKDPVSISKDKTTYDALVLMRQKRVDNMFITDSENHLCGYLNMFDIGSKGRRVLPLYKVMKKALSITKETKIMDAIRQIWKLDVKNLPVVDGENHFVGLITRATIVDTIYTNLWGSNEIENISDYENEKTTVIKDESDNNA